MNYKILANKWRPKIFSEISGHKYSIQAIINSLNEKKIHNSWLFTGTRGIGKTTIARILAKSLNCETSISPYPCRKCKNCIDVESGKFLDFIELDAASRTKVEDMRNLLETIHYLPNFGRFKIYLIDEVHMLSKHSFNALLKTLEEPPKHVKFILATTEIEKLPQTIRSRCLQFFLKPLKTKDIYKKLKIIKNTEKFLINNTALQLISNISNGSMRDALNTLELIISSNHKNNIINENFVRKNLGICTQEKIENLIKNIFYEDIKKILTILDTIEKDETSWNSVLTQLIIFFHNILIKKLCEIETIKENYFIYKICKENNFLEIKKYYKILINGKNYVKFLPNERMGVEMTIFELYYNIKKKNKKK